MPECNQDRQSERKTGLVRASLFFPDDFRDLVILCNISTGGFCAVAQGRVPKIGQDVVLDLSDMTRFLAIVRWNKGSRFGAEFVTPLSTDEMAAVLTTSSCDKVDWQVSDPYRVRHPKQGVLRRIL